MHDAVYLQTFYVEPQSLDCERAIHEGAVRKISSQLPKLKTVKAPRAIKVTSQRHNLDGDASHVSLLMTQNSTFIHGSGALMNLVETFSGSFNGNLSGPSSLNVFRSHLNPLLSRSPLNPNNAGHNINALPHHICQ